MSIQSLKPQTELAIMNYNLLNKWDHLELTLNYTSKLQEGKAG